MGFFCLFVCLLFRFGCMHHLTYGNIAHTPMDCYGLARWDTGPACTHCVLSIGLSCNWIWEHGWRSGPPMVGLRHCRHQCRQQVSRRWQSNWFQHQWHWSTLADWSHWQLAAAVATTMVCLTVGRWRMRIANRCQCQIWLSGQITAYKE